MKLKNYDFQKLYHSGRWMVHFSDEGKSYSGFQWKSLGEWTLPKKFSPKKTYKNGLFGQNEQANGVCDFGSRMELCEIRKTIILEDEVKTDAAKIVATDADIPGFFFRELTLNFSHYTKPLPKKNFTCRFFDAGENFNQRLPKGFSCEIFDAGERFNQKLPEDFACKRFWAGESFNQPLPAGFACDEFWVGKSFNQKLPTGFFCKRFWIRKDFDQNLARKDVSIKTIIMRDPL